MTTAVPVEGATTMTKSRAVAEATAVDVAAETSPAAVAAETSPAAVAMESRLPASYKPGAATSLHLEETNEGGCNRGQVSCHFYLLFFPFFSGDISPVIALGRI
jgi:hypothetical protein